jgi:hypothetical protein
MSMSEMKPRTGKIRRRSIVVIALVVMVVGACLCFSIMRRPARLRKELATACVKQYWREHDEGWRQMDEYLYLYPSDDDPRHFWVEGGLERGQRRSGFYLEIQLDQIADSYTSCECVASHPEVTEDRSFKRDPIRMTVTRE